MITDLDRQLRDLQSFSPRPAGPAPAGSADPDANDLATAPALIRNLRLGLLVVQGARSMQDIAGDVLSHFENPDAFS